MYPRARPIEEKTQNINIKCLMFQKSIIWPKPKQNRYNECLSNMFLLAKKEMFCSSYADEREIALLINFNQGAKLHSSHLWSCHEHQYLYEFSYDDEQEIFCFFLWWWTRKSDIDKFQFLMAAKLHSWQRGTCLVMLKAIMTLLETRNSCRVATESN